MNHSAEFRRKSKDFVSLQAMAQECAGDCTADYHCYDRMTGFACFSQCQLVSTGRFVHAGNFFHFAGAVARGVYDQNDRAFFSFRFIFISFHSTVYCGSHLVAFFQTDYAAEYNREAVIESICIVCDNSYSFIFQLSGTNYCTRAIVRIELSSADFVFFEGACVNNHFNCITATANHSVFHFIHVSLPPSLMHAVCV